MKRLTVVIVVVLLGIMALSLLGCTDDSESDHPVEYIAPEDGDVVEDSLMGDVGDGTAYISQRVVQQSATEITIEYTNNTDDVWMYGEGHSLQQLDRHHLNRSIFGSGGTDSDDPDDVWVDVEMLSDDLGWHDVGILLDPGESVEVNISLSKYYGQLERGIYRIVKEFVRDSSVEGAESAAGSPEVIQVITQFEVD